MWLKDLVEFIFGFGLFLNAGLFIPQIISLYKAKSSKGISLLMFLGFNFIQLSTILHAYYQSDYLLMIGYILSLLSCGMVTSLIIVYRKNNNDPVAIPTKPSTMGNT